jgi:hypothetical protein
MFKPPATQLSFISLDSVVIEETTGDWGLDPCYILEQLESDEPIESIPVSLVTNPRHVTTSED